VWLDDEKHTIHAKVETLGGYSAHADQQGLVEFVAGMKEKPIDIRLVHGEEHAKQALKEKLEALF
jgi:metallo-beta-lactamase family protein